jgi:hypothetical protein
VLILWSLAANTAHAQSNRVELHEGVTCLQAEALDAQLEPGIATTLEDEALTLHVLGSDEDPRSVVIKLTRGDELIAERSFSPGPPRCPDFHAAIAVTIGIMVRSVETRVVTPPPPEPAPVALPPPRPPAPARAAKPRRPLRFAPRASGLVGWGVEAPRARGFAAELELSAQRWAVRAGMLGLFSRDEVFEQVRTGYRTRPLTSSLDLCWRMLERSWIYADLCAGSLIGQLHSQGVRGADSVKLGSRSHAWGAVRGSLDAALRLRGGLWFISSVALLHGVPQVTLTAPDVEGVPRGRASLPRDGVLLGFGFAYEFRRQGSTDQEHE